MRSRLSLLGAETSGISTFTTVEELTTLFNLAAACPAGSMGVEIGSYLGASACYLAAGLCAAGGRLVCVDTWQNETMPEGDRDTFAEFNRNTKALGPYITPIRKRDEDLVDADLPPRIRIAFLDGDHSYEATRRAADRILPRIEPAGIAAFHDAIHWRGVSRVIGETLATGEYQFGGNIHNLIWLLKRSPDLV